jgi:hypothetical protein
MWKRYNIFISSTFKDMDFERDIIKQKVIPLLNAKLRDKQVELQAVDLRLGVNTEQMSEEESANKVLQVCARCIDEARPFFIGLVGARYGWIPPEERWQEFISQFTTDWQDALQETHDKSVTEIEIVYGALSQHSLDTQHTLFFMRDNDSYRGMSEERRLQFIDQHPAQQEKLDLLKRRIRNIISEKGGADDCVTDYHLRWDAANDEFMQEGNEFEQLITEQLYNQILKELDSDENIEWWRREKDWQESFLSRHLANACTDLPFYDYRAENTCYVGNPGDGRSTLLAYQWKLTQQETNDITLITTVGQTPYSRTMRAILTRWSMELAETIGEEKGDDKKFMDESFPFVLVCNEFYWLVDQAMQKGRKVSVFIDDVDAFNSTSPQDALMAWADRRINVVCTHGINVMYFAMSHPLLNTELLNPIKGETMRRLLKSVSQRFKLELPEKTCRLIMDKPRQTVYATIITRIMSMLDASSFQDIRQQEGSPIDALNQYITDVFRNIDSGNYEEDDEDTLESTTYFSQELILKNLGLDNEWWARRLGYLSHSPFGLRQKDLEALCGDDWDAVEWAQISYYLQEFIYEDAEHVWHSKTPYFGNDDDTPYEDLAEYTNTLPENDWLRQSMQLYYTLKTDSADYFNEAHMKMSASSAYILQQEGWIGDGNMADLCSKISKEDADWLTNGLRQMLFPDNEYHWAIDQKAIDMLDENLVKTQQVSKSDIKELLESIESIKQIYQEQNRYLAKQVLAPNGGEPPAAEKNIMAEFTKEACQMRSEGKLLDEVRYLMYSLISYVKYCKDNDPNHKYTSETEMENLTLQMINLYGAASTLYNEQEKNMTDEERECVDNVIGIATNCMHGCYSRLRQINAFNQLSGLLAPYLDSLYRDDTFYFDIATMGWLSEELAKCMLQSPFNNNRLQSTNGKEGFLSKLARRWKKN